MSAIAMTGVSQVLKHGATIIDKELVGSGALHELPFHDLKESMGSWIFKVLKDNFEKFGDMPWMTDLSTEKSMSYGQLIDSINLIGTALRNRGFRPNDTVLFMANNRMEMALAYLAVWSIEGCCASLGLNSMSDEIIRSKTKETGSKFILVDHQRAEGFQNAIRELKGVTVIVIGGRVDNCLFFDDLLLEGRIRDDNAEVDRVGRLDLESPVWLGFSSGTTGEPKGIVHAHSSMTIYALFRRMGAAPNPGEKKLATNGMIHGSGISGILDNVLGFGHQFIFSENVTGEMILQGISETKATCVNIYPREIIQICSLSRETTSKYDLSSVQTLKATGSHVLPIYQQKLAGLMPNLTQLTNNYAQTEAMALTAPLPRSPSRAAFLDLIKSPLCLSAGKVFPLVKLKFVDLRTGAKVGPNEMGEIAAKTPFLMHGYLNKPEESAKIMRDGWYHTGDVGYYNPDGNVFLIARVSELIKFKSYYVAPFKIEQQMILHPAVKEAAVVGINHKQDGQHPMAFVILKNPQDECETLLEEIKSFTNERVGQEERLRGGVRFTDRIPRNDAGKIVRFELTQLLL